MEQESLKRKADDSIMDRYKVQEILHGLAPETKMQVKNAVGAYSMPEALHTVPRIYDMLRYLDELPRERREAFFGNEGQGGNNATDDGQPQQKKRRVNTSAAARPMRAYPAGAGQDDTRETPTKDNTTTHFSNNNTGN